MLAGESLNSHAVNVVEHEAVAQLPDFRGYRDVAQKKARFFAYMLPLIQAENERITAVRKRLSYLYDHVRWQRTITANDQAWLDAVVEEFRLSELKTSESEFWQQAFARVDALPEDLALVQAAKESGWGTSRFAREGNNLFGQWCFKRGCGMVPSNRPPGEFYEVARYDSVKESVGSYMRNLNTSGTYHLLREIRSRLRHEGEAPNAGEMVAGLIQYSERGTAYVDELRTMLRQNAGMIEEVRRSGMTEGI